MHTNPKAAVAIAAQEHERAVNETNAARARFLQVQGQATKLRDKYQEAERQEAAALAAYMLALGRGPKCDPVPVPKE
jgi:hypothetical protein